MKLIVDEETGIRGYQATRDPRFLQPYVEAQGQLDGLLRELDSVPGARGPDGVPLHGIAQLKAAHADWKEHFAEPIIADLRAGHDVSDPDRNARGKLLMDFMRGEVAGVIGRAEQRRADRIRLWKTEVRWTEFGLFALAVASGLLIGLFTRNRMHWVSDTYKASLQDIQERAEEIFQSEQRLITTITSIGDGVITCDPEGRVEMMNTVAQEMTGWTQEEALARPLEQVFRIVNETTREPVENPVEKVRRLNRVVGLANHTSLLRRDGTEFQIADSGAPIRNKEEEIIGFVMVFRDVTMERRTQNAMVSQEKLAVAGRLAAIIAHEINNPLSSVLDMLYLMRGGVDESESRQYLQMAEAELTRVGEIVRAMLGLYRESQVPILVDLGSTMHEILLLVERRFTELGVRITTKLLPDVCVMGFPAELRQVFTNLITNAADAAGEGGEIEVSVSWNSDDSGQQPVRAGAVVIRDNGRGIEPQVLAQLFQPFFTTKGEHGTGLGLWVSQGIVSKHNGRLTLTSSTDPAAHGTTATVLLPAETGTIPPLHS